MKKYGILLFILSLITINYATEQPKDTGIFPLEKSKVFEVMERYIERHTIADIKAVFGFFTELASVPLTAEGCKDGVYIGETNYDDYKYKHVVTLKIKDGKVVSIHYDEQKLDGHGKRENKEYCDEMKKGTGASPAEAYRVYEKRFLEHQDLKKVDAVTGATYSLYRFRMAVIRALLTALSR